MVGASTLRTTREPGDAVAGGLAAAVLLLAVSTLIGHALGAGWLVSLFPGVTQMSFVTAALTVGGAAAVLADTRRRPRTTRILGALTLAGALAMAAALGVERRDGVSPWLVQRLFGHVSTAQTSVATAICLALLGLAGALRPRAQPPAALVIVVMIVAGVALLGYAYDVHDLHALSPFRTMSLRTAISLFGLASAALLANSQAKVSELVARRTSTGQATRNQLLFLLLPPSIGLMLVRLTSAHALGAGAAIALLVVLTIAPLAALVLRDAAAATRVEEAREARLRADAAALATERRYRALFDQAEVGLCIIELMFDAAGRAVDYRFVQVNPAFTAQTGIESAEGRRMREIAPDHEQHWFDTYGEVARTGEPLRFEAAAEALDRYYDAYAFRIDAPEDRRVAVLFTDISARRRSELALTALNETLEQRVAERAAELERAEDALRQAQKMEAIGQLTGGVAHDFNNLLTVIRGSVELARRPDIAEARRTRYLDAIGETADRATRLTSQLLAFARRQTLRPERFDAVEALEALADILRTLAGSRIALDLQAPSGPCFIEADRSQFETGVINLAVNARDAMGGEGRITLRVGGAEAIPPARGQSGVDGDFVAVELADTGAGIAADDVERIFEPFFTTKTVGAGTGLGLSQVIGFAKQSGGDVRVVSAPGEGAVFTLYFPRATHAPEPSPPPADEVAADGAGFSVLVVEDNASVGAFAMQALRELGFDALLATDGADALQKLARGDPAIDVVFSDVVMPGMTGLELGEALRRTRPSLPFVLTSGYSDVLAQDGQHGFELLRKPYSIDQLSRILHGALARRETPDAAAPG